jgi:hypothetical protein
MDKVEAYQEAVKSVLHEFVDYVCGTPSAVETIVVSDDQRHTYAVFDLGWEGKQRVCMVPVLMRIVDAKVWVEADNTDYVFVDRLLAAGVPKSDIVLAFHHPDMRKYTEFAIA